MIEVFLKVERGETEAERLINYFHEQLCSTVFLRVSQSCQIFSLFSEQDLCTKKYSTVVAFSDETGSSSVTFFFRAAVSAYFSLRMLSFLKGGGL